MGYILFIHTILYFLNTETYNPWKPWILMMPTLFSIVAPEVGITGAVIIITATDATSDDNIGIMTSLQFLVIFTCSKGTDLFWTQWHAWWTFGNANSWVFSRNVYRWPLCIRIMFLLNTHKRDTQELGGEGWGEVWSVLHKFTTWCMSCNSHMLPVYHIGPIWLGNR